MKKITLFFILGLLKLSANARDSYNFSHWGVGFFGSTNFPYADLKQGNQGKTFNITGYYNLTPYVPLGLEIQTGSISGGSIITDVAKRQYDNHYMAVIVHGDLALGEIMDYDGNFFLKFAKDLYIGTGFGMINNKMAFIQRTNLIATGYPVGTYTFPGQNSSANLIVPIRFGYEFKIYNTYGEPFIGLNIGYIHNLTSGRRLRWLYRFFNRF
ncbi:hypothetical protein HK413_06640 [Mucilaginibacter sp. S1162]|uniref:Outer membrane protein beta-barrel domain-containing protein n=1 Tax=Mucilaginibacter humi TaxID=2732510 RepID=A0ABX1W101_9SPHI|nr:hypothetical protein [Mucilaginibacter humi]NNU33902.1 hypothetical protein [Mucilaginibacter humi]